MDVTKKKMSIQFEVCDNKQKYENNDACVLYSFCQILATFRIYPVALLNVEIRKLRFGKAGKVPLAGLGKGMVV